MDRTHASMDSDQYLSRLEDFLACPLPKSLLAAHPNDVAKPSFALPPEWEAWWDWAASTSVAEPWVELLSYYVVLLNLDSCSQADRLFSQVGQRSSSGIPGPLSQLIDNVKTLQLTRSQGLPPVPAGYRGHLNEAQCIDINTSCIQTSGRGMSPKKLHEVSAMTAHIVHLVRTSPALKGVQHAVDIGAGQVVVFHCYLTPYSETKRLGLSLMEPTGSWYACLGSRCVRYPSKGSRETRIALQVVKRRRVLNISNWNHHPKHSSPIGGQVDYGSFSAGCQVTPTPRSVCCAPCLWKPYT